MSKDEFFENESGLDGAAQEEEHAGEDAPQDTPQAEEPGKESRSFAGELYEVASVIVTSVVTIAIIFTFLFRLVGVSGSSMLNTLTSGDWLIVKSLNFEPEYKDIVIITHSKYDDKTLVKRVIAVGGQKVDIDFDAGVVFVDDVPLAEGYTSTLTNLKDSVLDFPLTVPEGYVFVMGDNRNNSLDSRSKKVGLIEKDHILGKAVGRIFPIGGWDIYENSK
ncbi:MAG: signal peptidase I [Oscillospiraceae bacterium]|nr:signal peptidase I [Oscillospiraceae bacterium]